MRSVKQPAGTRLPRYLERFMVVGDAVHTMNPVYAQDITLAAGDSLALDRTLKSYRDRQAENRPTSLASAFQKELMEALADTWRFVVREDRRWPATQEATEEIVPRAGSEGEVENNKHADD